MEFENYLIEILNKSSYLTIEYLIFFIIIIEIFMKNIYLKAMKEFIKMVQ